VDPLFVLWLVRRQLAEGHILQALTSGESMRSRSRIRAATLAAFGVGMALIQADAGSGAQHEITISVPGIPGPYCMYGIEKRLAEMPEVEGVRLLWEADAIRFRLKPGATMTRRAIEEAIERAEYPYGYSVSL
jgi:hypothetical protein